ncbi:MFS transporter, ACS family, glucarate transporter [Nonomuraea solani]|uniref:MFS transporter, ACS family, glucarate transporter n=1 Tax=Nonomuraea solani TaxID=1144553 RepID=A0A1H6E3C7_9ACTN|nr:MFS transporter [Nonomuraea solani]SEG91594.1 MFS transporter, ACS family, glucarate transporter [Nonomuraea solani]
MQSNSATPAPAGPATARPARSRLRWSIIALSGLGLAIAYLDRSALSVASTDIQKDLGFDQVTKGILLSSFFWTYAIFQLPSGWLLDRFGPRLIYPIAVVWWSLWTAATALAHGVGTLLVTRLGLGMGEAPVQPANIKVVSAWFPRRERALASSLFDTGQQVGVALSVPVMAVLVGAFGWRAAFVVIGLVGMLWVIGWWMIYRSPQEHPKISQAELDYIEGGDAAVPETGPRVRWVELLRYPTVWGLVLGYICRSATGAFFLTWYPSYLMEARNFSLVELGIYGSIPSLLAVGATIAGGAFSDWLVRRGVPISRARKIPIITGMLLASTIALTTFVDGTLAVMILLSISNCAHSFAGAAILSLPAEVAPSPTVIGSVAGFQNFGSQIGNIISPILIGFFLALSGNSYTGPMLFAGAMAILGTLIYGFVVKVRPLNETVPAESRG